MTETTATGDRGATGQSLTMLLLKGGPSSH